MVCIWGHFLRSATSAHVKPVYRKAAIKRVPRQAPRITGVAGTFQTMHNHKLSPRRGGGALGMDQNFHPRFGLKVIGPPRPRFFRIRAAPEVTCNGGEMRIAKKRNVGVQQEHSSCSGRLTRE